MEDPFHTKCWTTSSNRVSAAAARPVVTPMRQTASQNREAPELASVVGIAPLFLATGVGIRNHTNEDTAWLFLQLSGSNHAHPQESTRAEVPLIGNRANP